VATARGCSSSHIRNKPLARYSEERGKTVEKQKRRPLINKTTVGTDNAATRIAFSRREGNFCDELLPAARRRIKAHTVRGILLQLFFIGSPSLRGIFVEEIIFCPARWTPSFKLWGREAGVCECAFSLVQ